MLGGDGLDIKILPVYFGSYGPLVLLLVLEKNESRKLNPARGISFWNTLKTLPLICHLS